MPEHLSLVRKPGSRFPSCRVGGPAGTSVEFAGALRALHRNPPRAGGHRIRHWPASARRISWSISGVCDCRPPSRHRSDAAVSLLVPARDEAHRIAPTIRSLLGSARADRRGDPGARRRFHRRHGRRRPLRTAGSDPRLRVLTGTPTPPGWLGKPHACAQLAAAARGDRSWSSSTPTSSCARRRGRGGRRAARPRAAGPALPVAAADRRRDFCGGLIQPLLAWSWLTTLPLRPAERSRAAVAWRRPTASSSWSRPTRWPGPAGGTPSRAPSSTTSRWPARSARSAAAPASPTARRSRRAACTTAAASCAPGYRKSLWAAFGSPAGALAVAAALAVVYVVPAGRRRGGLPDRARSATPPPSPAGVSAPAVVRWTFRRDALAHPLSVARAAVAARASSWRAAARHADAGRVGRYESRSSSSGRASAAWRRRRGWPPQVTASPCSRAPRPSAASSACSSATASASTPGRRC